MTAHVTKALPPKKANGAVIAASGGIDDAGEGSTQARADVEDWIVRLLGEATILSLEIVRRTPAGEERVGSISGKREDGGRNGTEIAIELCRALQDNANIWGGQQVYFVHCYREPNDPRFLHLAGKSQVYARFVFDASGGYAVTGGESGTDVGKVVENAFVAQAFRHAQIMGNQAILAVEKLNERDDREKNRLTHRAESIEDRWDRARELEEKARQERLAREEADLKSKREDMLYEMGAEMLRHMAPHLAPDLVKTFVPKVFQKPSQTPSGGPPAGGLASGAEPKALSAPAAGSLGDFYLSLNGRQLRALQAADIFATDQARATFNTIHSSYFDEAPWNEKESREVLSAALFVGLSEGARSKAQAILTPEQQTMLQAIFAAGVPS